MLRVIVVPAENPGRNLCYVVASDVSGHALLIDPIAPERCLAVARAHSLQVVGIVNTHEHRDHTGGNATVRAQIDVPIFAIAGSGIEEATAVVAGHVFSLATSVDDQLIVHHLPGHTQHHICLVGKSHEENGFWLTGDTIFAAGVGNCIRGGNVEALYQSVQKFPASRADMIYPGHDYLHRNLQFTVAIEPDNVAARQHLATVTLDTEFAATTMEEEWMHNCFFRLQCPSVVEGVRRRRHELGLTALPASSNDGEVFHALRELRNLW